MSTEMPETKEELIDHCLERLGQPMVKVNVTRQQARIRVKEAVKKFLDYHYESTDLIWIRHVLSDVESQQKWIQVPDYVHQILTVFNLHMQHFYAETDGFGTSLYAYLNQNFISNSRSSLPGKLDIWLYKRDLQDWESLFNASPHWHFNGPEKKLYMEARSESFKPGTNVMYKAAVDISSVNGLAFWSNDWLIRYTTCLIQEQWGVNLQKFEFANMPGGNRIRNAEILSEAKADKEKLLEELYANAMSTNPRHYMTIG